MEDQPHGTRRKQSRFRPLHSFSLRTLLILTTLIAVWLAWWSETVWRQRQAVASLRQLRARVTYDFEHAPGGCKDPPPTPDAPPWLVNLLGVDHFAAVDEVVMLEQTTDDHLDVLKGLVALKSLSLCNSKVTDTGLQHLRGLTKVKYLDLTGTTITDAGVARLQKALPNCKIVR